MSPGVWANSNTTAKRFAPFASGWPRREAVFLADIGGNAVQYSNSTDVKSTVTGVVGRSGRFDKLNSGRKAYGTIEQGDSKLAVKE